MTEFGYVVQVDLELSILLPQPPKCWNYRHYAWLVDSFFIDLYCSIM
jgi:hypothetical protein